MEKNIKVLLAAMGLILIVASALLDNQTLVASSLVALLLALTRIRKPEGTGNDEGNAARRAIFAFAILVILANLVIPCVLPYIAAKMDFSAIDLEMTSVAGTTNLTGEREHFLAVMINDMHELCYTTSILLLIQLCLNLFAVWKGKKAIKKDARGKRQ